MTKQLLRHQLKKSSDNVKAKIILDMRIDSLFVRVSAQQKELRALRIRVRRLTDEARARNIEGQKFLDDMILKMVNLGMDYPNLDRR